MSVAVFKHSEG